MCGRAYDPRFLWMWPNARISVMGGEQAASVLAQVRKDGLAAKGHEWPAAEEGTFKRPIRQQYEHQGHPISPARGCGMTVSSIPRFAAGARPRPFCGAECAHRPDAFGIFRM